MFNICDEVQAQRNAAQFAAMLGGLSRTVTQRDAEEVSEPDCCRLNRVYVYMAVTGVEVYLPSAVEVRADEDVFALFDVSGKPVAVFPVRSVVLYSPQPLPVSAETSGDSST